MADIVKDVDDTKTQSFILIHFEHIGDGNPQLIPNNVNAFQIMGAAAALEVYGKNMFIRELNELEERRQQTQLAVPRPEILKP
jgi:hypothetical protein